MENNDNLFKAVVIGLIFLLLSMSTISYLDTNRRIERVSNQIDSIKVNQDSILRIIYN
jgi:hypothetical protein